MPTRGDPTCGWERSAWERPRRADPRRASDRGIASCHTRSPPPAANGAGCLSPHLLGDPAASGCQRTRGNLTLPPRRGRWVREAEDLNTSSSISRSGIGCYVVTSRNALLRRTAARPMSPSRVWAGLREGARRRPQCTPGAVVRCLPVSPGAPGGTNGLHGAVPGPHSQSAVAEVSLEELPQDRRWNTSTF